MARRSIENTSVLALPYPISFGQFEPDQHSVAVQHQITIDSQLKEKSIAQVIQEGKETEETLTVRFIGQIDQTTLALFWIA